MDIEEFFDAAKALVMQPPAGGKNVAILTDAGGPGIMAADECEVRRLIVKRFSDETVRKFERLKEEGKIPKFAAHLNPVDVTGSVTSEMFELAAEIIFEDSEIDGVILL
jgi:acetyltransferase